MTESTHRQKAQAERKVEVTWEGHLGDGSGTIVKATSGQLRNLPVSWPARTEDAGGKTSPEELLAAAHASCYAMQLSHEVEAVGGAPGSYQISANVGFDPRVGGGFEVSFSHLDVRGSVPGLDDAGFQKAAEAAAKGCPISAALAGNVEITVDASLD